MDREEILRYLGAPGGEDILEEQFLRAQREVVAAAKPRSVWRLFPLEIQGDAARIGGTVCESGTLASHLQGCRECALFACTLGPEVDRLIRRYTVTEIAFVPVLQAVAAAYTEEQADSAQAEIERYAKERGLYLRPRYSPGYGDFSLAYQTFLFSALEVTKRLGVTLTDSLTMIPFKSVTAVIGLSPDPSSCHLGRCMVCAMENCPFRKES